MTIIVELTAEETKRVYGAIGLNLTPGTTLRNTVGEGADAIGSAVRINADGSSTCATELYSEEAIQAAEISAKQTFDRLTGHV
jgi:hypothetical protein